MTIKHPITGERTGYFDENATALNVGDTVVLFGQNGTKLPFVKRIDNKEVIYDDKKAC